MNYTCTSSWGNVVSAVEKRVKFPVSAFTEDGTLCFFSFACCKAGLGSLKSLSEAPRQQCHCSGCHMTVKITFTKMSAIAEVTRGEVCKLIRCHTQGMLSDRLISIIFKHKSSTHRREGTALHSL